MKLVIGSDHGGFDAKEMLKGHLQSAGHAVTDFGCYSKESVDYPDVAQLVAEAVSRGDFERGILVDGFGGAVCFVANKVPGVRAICAYDSVSARFSMEHDDANVLCLGGQTHGPVALKEIVDVFFSTRYGGGRHDRRLGKALAVERKHMRAA